jgi:hypothetical protein
MPAAFTTRPLGRDTTATINAWSVVRRLIQAAPPTFRGPTPEESPRIYRFCPGGFDNQWVGMCVGKGSKNAAATLLRIPPGGEENATPLPTQQLSGLYCYLNARRKGIEIGSPILNRPNDPNSGGAVVAFSMLAMQDHGVVLDADYPDTQANQLACSDNPLPDPLYAKGVPHKVIHCARLEQPVQWQEFQAAGYPIVFGVAITQGWMNTDEDGRIRPTGAGIGGHCMMAGGYSRRQNRQYIRNSWIRWGMKTDDPEFQVDCEGWNNIGWVELDWFESMFLRPGGFDGTSIDAFVLNDVPGFPTRIQPRKAEGLFT